MVTVAPEEKVSSKTVFDTKGLAVIWGRVTCLVMLRPVFLCGLLKANSQNTIQARTPYM